MRALATATAAMVLASCGGGGGGGGDSTPSDPSVWHFRAVNVVSDAPLLQFYVDDTPVSTADYGTATDYKPAHTGDRPVKVALRNASRLETDDPGYTDIGDEQSYDFEGPTDYTVVETGTVAQPRQFLITGTSQVAVEDNKIEYQVVNAATNSAGPLSVYITAPGAGVDSPKLIDSLALGASSDKANLDLVAASGASDDAARSTTVAFQVRSTAGVILQTTTLPIAEQTRLLIVVADNVAVAGDSPVKLFLFGGSAAGAGSVLTDISDPGELRLANTSPDSGPLDLIVGSTAADVHASNVVFGQASDYDTFDPAVYNTIGTPHLNPGAFLFVNPVTIAAGRSYTMYAQGPLVNMRGLLFADDRRSVPTETHFRFLYTAASQGKTPLDVYLTRHGTALDLTADTPPTPNISGLAYTGMSARLILDNGTYDAYFTLTGKKDIVLGPIVLTLPNGSVKTLAVADSPSGELELVAFDDSRE